MCLFGTTSIAKILVSDHLNTGIAKNGRDPGFQDPGIAITITNQNTFTGRMLIAPDERLDERRKRA